MDTENLIEYGMDIFNGVPPKMEGAEIAQTGVVIGIINVLLSNNRILLVKESLGIKDLKEIDDVTKIIKEIGPKIVMDRLYYMD